MQRLRMRTMAYVIGLLLAGFTVATAFALPVIPVLGVAVAAAAVVVNQVAFRLVQPTCYGCGKSIAGLRGGAYGVECPECGTLTQVLPKADRVAAGPRTGDAATDPRGRTAEACSTNDATGGVAPTS